MKLGLGLPLLGTLASPGAIRTVAVAAEAAGFDSVWAMDRLLSPVAPRTLSCPGRSDGTLPVAQQTVIDPLVALTIAEHVKIGTDVLVAPWYPPVLLARTLAALDQVSTGRLVVGLGLDWSVDEFEAVGAPMPRRGRRTEEILDVLDAVWGDDTIDITTTHERIARGTGMPELSFCSEFGITPDSKLRTEGEERYSFFAVVRSRRSGLPTV